VSPRPPGRGEEEGGGKHLFKGIRNIPVTGREEVRVSSVGSRMEQNMEKQFQTTRSGKVLECRWKNRPSVKTGNKGGFVPLFSFDGEKVLLKGSPRSSWNKRKGENVTIALSQTR